MLERPRDLAFAFQAANRLAPPEFEGLELLDKAEQIEAILEPFEKSPAFQGAEIRRDPEIRAWKQEFQLRPLQ